MMIQCELAMKEKLPCVQCCYTCQEHCLNACVEISKDCPNAKYVPNSTNLEVMTSTVPEVLREITRISVEKKKLDEREKRIKSQLVEAMERNNIKSFENELVKFVYVAPTVRESIDSKKLKKEFPDIARRCVKETKVSASVRVSVK